MMNCLFAFPATVAGKANKQFIILITQPPSAVAQSHFPSPVDNAGAGSTIAALLIGYTSICWYGY